MIEGAWRTIMKMDIRKGRVVMACETDTDGNGDGDVHVDRGRWMVCVNIDISSELKRNICNCPISIPSTSIQSLPMT
jgi:hypothetical protein